jgi:hypothetical protein
MARQAREEHVVAVHEPCNCTRRAHLESARRVLPPSTPSLLLGRGCAVCEHPQLSPACGAATGALYGVTRRASWFGATTRLRGSSHIASSMRGSRTGFSVCWWGGACPRSVWGGEGLVGCRAEVQVSRH